MKKHDRIRRDLFNPHLKRRELLRKGLAGLGVGAGIGALGANVMAPGLFGRVAEAAARAAARRSRR